MNVLDRWDERQHYSQFLDAKLQEIEGLQSRKVWRAVKNFSSLV